MAVPFTSAHLWNHVEVRNTFNLFLKLPLDLLLQYDVIAIARLP